MNTVKILNNNKVVEVEAGIRISDFMQAHYSENMGEVLVAILNNELVELSRKIEINSDIKFLTIKDRAGFKAYQTSTLFLLITAIKEHYGIETKVVVKHSIGKNLYLEVPEKDVKADDIIKIQQIMEKKVEDKIHIEKHLISIKRANEVCDKGYLQDKKEVIKYRRGSTVNMYKLDWFYDYFYGSLVLDLSKLVNFKVSYVEPNIVLQLPDSNDINKITEIKDFPKISEVFEEAQKWSSVLGIDTVAKLNNKITQNKFNEVIRLSEELHEKKLSTIADMIKAQNKKLVLIAGPSSSGKTTFAHRLSDHLRVNGLTPNIISLDDYYLNRDDIPFGPDGKQNFEVVESLDIAMINRDIKKILAGEEVEIPSFNFKTGVKEYKGHKIHLKENDIIVMEGIHGLNEIITKEVKKEDKFKVFISALTTLSIDNHNRIATTDTRLIRRLVRDFHSRGFGAEGTIDMWPTVLEGEVNNIFPYQNEADAVFNSALVYELSVLKSHVEPLLFNISYDSPSYQEARRLIKFLENFLVPTNTIIPATSIVREFVGGGAFF